MREFQLLNYSISHIFLVWYLTMFTTRRYSKMKTALIAGMSAFVLVWLEYIEYVCFSQMPLVNPALISKILVVQGTALLLSRYRDWRALFTGLSSSNYALFGALTGYYVYVFNKNCLLAALFCIMLNAASLILMIVLMRSTYLKVMTMNSDNWKILCLLPAFAYVTAFLINAAVSVQANQWIAFVATASMLLMIYLFYVLIFYNLHQRSEKERISREKEIMGEGIRSLQKEMEEIRKTEKKIAVQVHDQRHFVRMMKHLLIEQDYQGIEQALEQMGEPVIIPEVNYCSCIPLNAVATHYAAAAQEADIDILLRMDDLEHLHVNEWELAVVVGNLLENAINYCTPLQSADQRKIWASVTFIHGRILVEVKNTIAGMVEFDPETHLPISKQGDGHGIGMRSILYFVENNEGIFDCGIEGDVYYFRLLV